MVEHDETASPMATDRRGFLTTTGAILAAGKLLFGDWRPAQAAGTLPKRKLGRTGCEVTVLSFGGIQLADASHQRVLEDAIDKGINFIHTAAGYTGGRSIQVVGEAMKTRRDKVFLAIKTSPRDVDRCLKILNTDHIDVLIPDHGDFSDGPREAFTKVKESGKIRAIGFACHKGMAERLERAITAGWLDVMLSAYNEGVRGELDEVMARAVKEQKMGFMAMKVRHRDFGAGLRSLLRNPNLATVTPGMASTQQVDQNLAALTQENAQTRREDREHAQWVADLADAQCNLCGHCDHSCPQRIALGEYLRADLYRERGDAHLAQQLVAAIPPRQSLAACNNCGACTQSCRRRVDVLGVARGMAGV